MAEEKAKKEKPQSSKESFFRLAQVLLAGIGVFGALTYFLGRLYIEEYYYALGITPHVLYFKPEDYMFSSFNLVIMCLGLTIWLYMYWKWAKPETRLVLGFPIAKGKKGDIFALILTYLFWLFAIWNITTDKPIGIYIPGFIGIIASYVIGIGAILFASLSKMYPHMGSKSIVGILLLALLLLASLPSITTRIAVIQAKNDMTKFPQAMLVCEDVLPHQLQSSSQTPNESIEVRIITTNNGMTYALSTDNESTDNWQIYAIPETNIKQIIYLHRK